MVERNLRFVTKPGWYRYLDQLKEITKKNRNSPTKAEQKFWEEVVRKDKSGYRFLRQKPVNRYILDFYCSELHLAIEIDEDSHDNKKGQDENRDYCLAELAIKTVRFTNNEVLSNIFEVARRLNEIIFKREQDLYK